MTSSLFSPLLRPLRTPTLPTTPPPPSSVEVTPSSSSRRSRRLRERGLLANNGPSASSFHTLPAHQNAAAEEEAELEPRDADACDVLIVGAGPAGLAAAIRIKQNAEKEGTDLRVCVIEKAAAVGDHIVSGAVIEPRGLAELFPDWKELGAPLETAVTKDKMLYLTKDKAIPLPIIKSMHNEGNYIASLGNVCRWLGEKAEELGIEIYAGFPGSELLYHDDGSVKGVATRDMGIAKNGKPSENFERGLELHAPLTILAEGARGSLSQQLMAKFDLRKDCDPQSYGIGLKEVWEVPKEKHQPGLVLHTVGYPLEQSTYGGSFMYHFGENKVSIGYVVGLDYENPYLSPYKEFQRLKHHPAWAEHLEGGKCVSYGARAINEGGFQAIPELVVPGAAMIGCAAGFLNMPKIKGSHTAIKSGIVAGDAAFNLLKGTSVGDISEVKPATLSEYPVELKKSWLWEELHNVRNVRPAFQNGLFLGSLFAGIHWLFTKGKEPFTLHVTKPDHEHLKKASDSTPIEYPKPDGKLSFDLLTNLARSGTNHNEDQPAHLTLKDDSVPVDVNLDLYDGPEGRYCPAGVYEFVEADNGKKKLQINAQNCLHCKTCDIKDPTQNIVWTVPEGGGGPAYTDM
eukprot:TRINITY_DN3129_c0_g1_i1.p1 TRINITY_DN3129_c0_g1~~TRINITY_DN3129_c0_g1_i1.p1  ORF type:complete len:627 (+),score=166.61 TRINITY_DN3129_c0_g1_i1:2-1882(+)